MAETRFLGGDAQRARLIDRTIEKLSPATVAAYDSDLRYVHAWGLASGAQTSLPIHVDVVSQFVLEHLRDGLPEETERRLVSSRAKRPGPHSHVTVKRRLASISVAHTEAGLPNPVDDPRVRMFMSRVGLSRSAAGWRPKRARAAHGDVLEMILETCEDSVLGIRDRALILFGVFSGGRRRSEIHAATIDRLVPVGSDYEYRLGPSKSSQASDTGVIPVYGRCARAMDEWLSVSGVGSGHIFRALDPVHRVLATPLSGRGIDRIVKRRAELAGLGAVGFSSHSLRSGFMTEACRNGIPIQEAMGLSFHASTAAAEVYYRAGDGLGNLAAKLSG